MTAPPPTPSPSVKVEQPSEDIVPAPAAAPQPPAPKLESRASSAEGGVTGARGIVTGNWAPSLGEAWPLGNDIGNGRHGAVSSTSSPSGTHDGRPSKEVVLE